MVFEYIFLGAFRYYNRRLREAPYVAALSGGGILVALASANVISLLAFAAQRGSDRYAERLINMAARFGPWTFGFFVLLAAYLVGTTLGSATRREQIENRIDSLSRSDRARL